MSHFLDIQPYKEQQKCGAHDPWTHYSVTTCTHMCTRYKHVPLFITYGRTILVHSVSLVCAVACSFLERVEIPTILWLLQIVRVSHVMYMYIPLYMYNVYMHLPSGKTRYSTMKSIRSRVMSCISLAVRGREKTAWYRLFAHAWLPHDLWGSGFVRVLSV